MRATASVRGSESTTSARTEPSLSRSVAPQFVVGPRRPAANAARLPMAVIAGTPAAASRAPIALGDVPADAEERMVTGIGEFDRVLGGGIVQGSCVLLGGDPGIGKSSLLMQASAALATKGTVLYVSGEESAAQIKMRARRFDIASDGILVLAETDLGSVIEAIRRVRPIFVVVDSIQTMNSDAIASAAGGVSQDRKSVV